MYPYLQVSQFSTTILSAMLAGMDDREDPADLITMEAMSGLARIFEKIDEGHVRPILINIALRIRPCFEKVNNYSYVGAVCTLCRKEVLVVSHDQYRNSSHTCNSSLENLILKIETSFCSSISDPYRILSKLYFCSLLQHFGLYGVTSLCSHAQLHVMYIVPLPPPTQPTPAVRAAAFTLFGSLSRFGNGPSEQPFLEQIQTNFVTLLVHLNESDPVVVMVSLWGWVRRACKHVKKEKNVVLYQGLRDNSNAIHFQLTYM